MSFVRCKSTDPREAEEPAASQGGPLVVLRGVSKAYASGNVSQKALDDVSLEIDEGKFVAILGPSGSGKSTLLNIIGGMDTPTEGTVTVAGKDITHLSDNDLTDYRAENVSFIFQFYNLISNLTARENIALTNSIVSNSLDPDVVLESVGLKDCGYKFPSQLSGGEQQRVSIARALAKNTSIVLGDEPTGALDAKTGVSVLLLLQRMCSQEGKTILVVTHNAAVAECADVVIRLKDGRITSIEENASPKRADEITW